MPGKIYDKHSTPENFFESIEVKKPAEMIIEQIQKLISTGKLKPGDKLPPERVLSEKFGVGRGYVREALKKLEFYGILKTYPQKGTFVSSLGVKTLEGLITNVLNIEPHDLESIMEVRSLLEVHAARLAATRATDEEIGELKAMHEDFRNCVEEGATGLEADHLFHLKIASVSRNSVLRSLIGLITPDIIFMSKNAPPDTRYNYTLKEHEEVLEGIISRDPDKAAAAMQHHMEMAHKRRLERLKK